MGIRKNKIRFTVIDGSSKQIIETYDGEYRNLMFLLRDKIYLDYFGECGGMGRCATCVIKIKGLSGNSINKERNEPVTLSKMGYEDENIRLSCQLFIRVTGNFWGAGGFHANNFSSLNRKKVGLETPLRLAR